MEEEPGGDSQTVSMEDFNKLKSKLDSRVAELEKAVQAKEEQIANLDPATDDLGVQKQLEKFKQDQEAWVLEQKSREDKFAQDQLEWARNRISHEYKVPLEELKDFSDAQAMEIYALKNKKEIVDKTPDTTNVRGSDRLRTGLEKSWGPLFQIK